jgi:hypothetical protein
MFTVNEKLDKKNSIIDYKIKTNEDYIKLCSIAKSFNLNQQKYKNIYENTIKNLKDEELKFANKEEKYSILKDNIFNIHKLNESCMNIYISFYNYIKQYISQKHIDIFIDKVNHEDKLIKQQQEEVINLQIEEEKNKLITDANYKLSSVIFNGGCYFYSD